MARIPEQFIDQLIARTDIVELIDQRVPLQRAGHEHRACCPFHDEKTPSFYVSPAKQFYHCFGCGAHGTAVGFLMNYDNLDFVEAIETLASRAGMEVPRDGTEQAKPATNHQGLHEVLGRARDWYAQQLKDHPDAKQAIDYLKSRGLDGKTALGFGIGFAPDGWNNLSTALGADATTTKALVNTGLLITKDDGGHYDRFRQRIMFPIEDYRGKLIGFGGRIIGQGEPKYLNSPETVLFHKGSELYGLHQARREIGLAAESVVVEGYMDVIGLAQNGIKHAVATMGTATTASHLQRLFRAAPAVVFCFDGDRAGRKAAWKAMQAALPLLTDERQVSFLLLPQGEDPDSLIRQEGTDAFKARLAAADPLPSFLFDSLSNELDLSRLDHRARLADQAKPLLDALPAGTFRQLMVERLSQIVGLSEQALAESPKQKAAAPIPTQKKGGSLSPIALAISLLVQQPQLAGALSEYFSVLPNDEESLKGSTLLQELFTCAQVGPELNTAQLLERMRSHPQHAALEKLAGQQHLGSDDKKSQVLQDCLIKLQNECREQELNALLQLSQSRRLNDAENTTLLALLQAQRNRAAD